jgi:salicylate hydroxylase
METTTVKPMSGLCKEKTTQRYRAVIGTNPMLHYPEPRPFVLLLCMSPWEVGERRSVLCSKRKKEYDLMLIHPDDELVQSWTEKCSRDKTLADFARFEPRCVTEM